jgi:hypothetical protein
MITKCSVLFFLCIIFSYTLMGCSEATPENTSSSSAYTPEEITFDQKMKVHLTDIQSHIHNFDTLSKNAKPPYNDPTLIGNLENELEQAAQESQAITDFGCPSSRFDRLCGDFVTMRDVTAAIRDDMKQYYNNGLSASDRQKVSNDLVALKSASQKIADDYAQLETQFGKIK